MSRPVSACEISRAALSEEHYQHLRETISVNMRYGHWTTFGCDCAPPCPPPTEEQLRILNERLAADCPPAPQSDAPMGEEGPPGPAS